METAAGSQLKLDESKMIGLYQRACTRTKNRGGNMEQISTSQGWILSN
jgi:hypothetical protein